MKLIFVALCAVLLTNCSTPSEQVVGNRALSIVEELHNAKSKNVLVVAHRGDWRNYPENSLEGFQSAINMGVDIIELDIQMTLDSVLVVCHDPKINRTTTGRGWIHEITADSIRKCHLKTGHDVAMHLHLHSGTCFEPLRLQQFQMPHRGQTGFARMARRGTEEGNRRTNQHLPFGSLLLGTGTQRHRQSCFH